MRLVLHPKIYSDIAQVMEYYEQVASADLADEFMQNCGSSCVRQRRDLNHSRSANVIFAEPICGDFHIIFCSASPTMPFEFWSSATTKENRL
jgi:hypothetical protein